MTVDAYSPEEFARLMALPEDHPDRIAAAASPRFEASRRMLAEFERPGDALQTGPEIASATAELSRRLADAGVLASPSVTDAAAGPPRAVRRPGAGRFGWLRAPAARTALAFAGAAIVAGFGWWATHRPAPVDMVRGVSEPGAFEVMTRREGDALILSWKSVEGADGYRIVFLGPDLAESAHLEVSGGTEFVLRADALPAGIVAGTRVSLEIVALRQGAPVATTQARTVLLP